jgi:putative Ca2+/H+ antiporter (TMEM165/GDT1 family)
MRYVTERLEDLIAGLITAGIGIFIITEASNYKMGTLVRMGPAYFPTIIGVLMLVLAAIMLLTAHPSEAPQPVGKDQLRGTIFVAAGIIAFAYTIEFSGMLLSVFLAVFMSTLGNRTTPILTALLLAVITSLGTWLIFCLGLGLQIEAF